MNITQHNTEISNERPAVDAQNPVASGDRRLTDTAYLWVEVTSHRSRDYLKRYVLNGNMPYAYMPNDFMTKSGEYYRIHSRYAEAVAKIKGLKIRKRLSIDDLSRCWGYEPGEREVAAS